MPFRIHSFAVRAAFRGCVQLHCFGKQHGSGHPPGSSQLSARTSETLEHSPTHCNTLRAIHSHRRSELSDLRWGTHPSPVASPARPPQPCLPPDTQGHAFLFPVNILVRPTQSDTKKHDPEDQTPPFMKMNVEHGHHHVSRERTIMRGNKIRGGVGNAISWRAGAAKNTLFPFSHLWNRGNLWFKPSPHAPTRWASQHLDTFRHDKTHSAPNSPVFDSGFSPQSSKLFDGHNQARTTFHVMNIEHGASKSWRAWSAKNTLFTKSPHNSQP